MTKKKHSQIATMRDLPKFSMRRSARAALSRRGFVKGVGLSAAALPFLRTLKGHAQDRPPQRFLFIFTPNGTIPEAWEPSGGERDFRLGTILEPLERHRSKLMIAQGLNIGTRGIGDAHQQGMGLVLTGSDLLPGDTMGGCDSCAPVSWSSGMSIDQLIANEIGGETAYRSIELGLQCGGGANVWSRMCYRGASDPIPPEQNPYAAFDRIFGGGVDTGPSESELDRFRNQMLQQSVIDFVKDDFDALRARLGSEDRVRLDSHLAGVRDIERRLDLEPPMVDTSCELPELGGRIDLNNAGNYPRLGQHQMDLITMAFACDLTRVATMQWNRSVGNQTFPWLGFNDRHHDLSHEGDGNATARNKITQINRWYAEQVAYQLDALDAIPEGDGTMLDNTLVLWGNELGKGNSHTRNNIPFVLAGNANGQFDMGRYLRFGGVTHNNMLLTIAQAFGIERSSFGTGRYNSGPLTRMLA